MDYHDPEWVSAQLGLDRNTVYRLLQDGTLPAVQLGRKWLISESNLNRWLLEETDRQTRTRQSALAAQQRLAARLRTLSPAARDLVRIAFAEARRYNQRHLGPEHMLLALASDPAQPVARLLAAHGLDLPALRQRFQADQPPAQVPSFRRPGRRPRARKAMRLATAEARATGARLVQPEHLLLGLLASREGVGYDILSAADLTLDRARNLLKQETA